MTKRVRIENADMSDYRVTVQVWEKGRTGTEDQTPGPDTLVSEHRLDYPTAMTSEDVYLTSSRYIIVKELPPNVGYSKSPHD